MERREEIFETEQQQQHAGHGEAERVVR